jgi:serine protease inhibitor
MIRWARKIAALFQAPRAEGAEIAVHDKDVSGRAFGAALYGELKSRDGNMLVSPVSILAAMGIVADGAKGETRAAILDGLRLMDSPTLGDDLGGMLGGLERNEAGAKLRIANALWVNRNFALKPSFAESVQTRYGASAAALDFASAPDEAVREINGWVAQKTNDRINRGMVQRDTRLIVTNAVWFLGDWMNAFDRRFTHHQPFFLANGTTKTVPLMTETGRFRHIEVGGAQIIDLPYVGGKLSMTVLLPRQRGRLAEVESALEARLKGWLSELDGSEPRTVELYLPKLQMELEYDLGLTLKAMGMQVAFGPGADLSGITDLQLEISDVVHKTFLRIDEKGTEAAAATAVVMTWGSAAPEPSPVFRADHPFVFLIRDRDSGALLFLGRVASPEAPPA